MSNPAVFKVHNMAEDLTLTYTKNDCVPDAMHALLFAHFQDIGLKNTDEYPALAADYLGAGRVLTGRRSASIGKFAIVL